MWAFIRVGLFSDSVSRPIGPVSGINIPQTYSTDGDDKAWRDQELSPSLCGGAGFQHPVVWRRQDFSALCPWPVSSGAVLCARLVCVEGKEGVDSAVSYLESKSCRLGAQVKDEINQLRFSNPQTHHAHRLHFFFLSDTLCQVSFLCSRELQILLCSYHW